MTRLWIGLVLVSAVFCSCSKPSAPVVAAKPVPVATAQRVAVPVERPPLRVLTTRPNPEQVQRRIDAIAAQDAVIAEGKARQQAAVAQVQAAEAARAQQAIQRAEDARELDPTVRNEPARGEIIDRGRHNRVRLHPPAVPSRY